MRPKAHKNSTSFPGCFGANFVQDCRIWGILCHEKHVERSNQHEVQNPEDNHSGHCPLCSGPHVALADWIYLFYAIVQSVYRSSGFSPALLWNRKTLCPEICCDGFNPNHFLCLSYSPRNDGARGTLGSIPVGSLCKSVYAFAGAISIPGGFFAE